MDARLNAGAAVCSVSRQIVRSSRGHCYRCIGVAAAFVTLALHANAAHAQLQTTTAGCIQDVATKYGGPSGIHCTANDVSIGLVTLPATPVDGCDYLGDTTTFDAIVKVQSTATERYDIGIYLSLDGGAAYTGSCLISTLPYTPSNNNPACAGSGNPFACCTGVGTGTCAYSDLDSTTNTGMVCSSANTQICNDNSDCTGSVPVCTGAGAPFACCTGNGTGSSCGTCITPGALQDLCGDITSTNAVYYKITGVTVSDRKSVV